MHEVEYYVKHIPRKGVQLIEVYPLTVEDIASIMLSGNAMVATVCEGLLINDTP